MLVHLLIALVGGIATWVSYASTGELGSQYAVFWAAIVLGQVGLLLARNDRPDDRWAALPPSYARQSLNSGSRGSFADRRWG